MKRRAAMAGLAALCLTGCSSNKILDTLNDCSLPYTADLKEDYWQTVKETKERGTGDCEDLAFYLNDELQKKGYNSRVVFGLMSLTSKTGHAWVQLKYKGTQYVLDPTGNIMFEKRYPFSYIEFPEYMFKNKLKDWEARNARP